jgi:hypothetical protein
MQAEMKNGYMFSIEPMFDPDRDPVLLDIDDDEDNDPDEPDPVLLDDEDEDLLRAINTGATQL